MAVDPQITVGFLSFAGAIGVAYITTKYKGHIISKNRNKQPRDRMDTIFDGYESLIKQQQSDIERKSKQLDQTQHIIDRLQEELNQTKKIVQAQQEELQESKLANKDLIQQLSEMKKHYTGSDKTKQPL